MALVESLTAGIPMVSEDMWNNAPIEITDAAYTVAPSNFSTLSLIANRAGTVTLTMPDAVAWSGLTIQVKTIQAQAVASAASDVVPLTGGSASTGILAATDGKWATLTSDGTSWIIMAAN